MGSRAARSTSDDLVLASTKLVTDGFEKTLEICAKLGLKDIAKSYTSFMNALSEYRVVIRNRLRMHFQRQAEQIGGKYFRTNKRVLLGFDGSRATAPRSIANEKAFCAPNYGHSNKAKYGKKKSKGLLDERDLTLEQIVVTTKCVG